MSAVSDSWSHRLDSALRLAQSGAVDEAAGELIRLAGEHPEQPLPRILLATLRQQAGDISGALREIDLALKLAPGDSNALGIRARLLLLANRPVEAEAAARDALALAPEHLHALYDLACALEGQQRWDEAAMAGTRAIAVQPGHVASRRLLARCKLMRDDVDAALAEALDPAMLAHPESALAFARDLAARGLHRHQIALLQKLVGLHRDNHECVMALADAFHSARQTSNAMAQARRAILLRPEASRPKLMIAAGLLERGETQAGLAGFRELLAQARLDAVDEQRYLIALHYDPAQEPAAMLAAHLDWAARHAPPSAEPLVENPIGPRLRIGWLSPRFTEGPVARFLTGLLAAFDRERHQQVLLELHPLRDDCTRILENLADEVVALHGLDDDALLARLRTLQLDVLIDLAGHAPFSRPQVLARRAAPIQLSWLDWFDTTGLPNMDGWISDPWLSPSDSPQRFSERLLRLRSGRFCYTPPEWAPEPSRADDGPVTFVSFNRTAKLHDAVIAAWARILDATPQAKLLIGAGELDDPGARAFLLERFAARGIGAARLRTQGQRNYAELLAAYRHADIALDPFPFSGCTTSCDALWMGVPVVTLPGWSVVSRQTASLLWRLDRPQWVAPDIDDYVARAVSLAGAVDEVRRQRAALREAVRTHLCDASAQAAEFAALLHRLVDERGADSRIDQTR